MLLLASTTTEPVEVPEPTIPVRARKQPLRVLLTGTDGSTWDLTNGPVRLQPGVRGLTATVERFLSESANADGAISRGHRTPARQLTMNVRVRAADGLAWRELDRMLWRALSPHGVCTLTVTAPDAEARTLSLLSSPEEDEFDRDPFVLPHKSYPLTFDVVEPFWRGATIVQTFRPRPDAPRVFDPAGGVMNLLPNSALTRTAITNPGDEAAFWVASALGSMASFRVGVGDSTVDYGPLGAGRTVWIDSHPTVETIGFSRGGNDEAAWLGVDDYDFAPIPSGAEVPIVVELGAPDENALVAVELETAYRRPW